MKLANELNNHLLKRKEYILEMTHMGTPSTAQVVTLVAEHFKVGEDHVSIKKINNKTGTSQFIVDALVYESAEQRTKIEPKAKQKKEVAN